MTFKTRTIRLSATPQPFKKLRKFGKMTTNAAVKPSSKILSYFIVGTLLVFGMFVVMKVTLAAYHFVSEFTPASILEVVGKDLKKDENNYTNIVLLGDGGYIREGGGLIDTIMVASIDYEKNAVSMISVPRDYYVGKNINLGLDRYGKINQIYNNYNDLTEPERFEKIKLAVGELVDLDIQYYMRIDFDGFVEIVDSLGGISINVPKAINDPTYPNKTDTGYSPFKIQAGLQDLDGETALKYARSRHTSSDFDRAARQQLILEAIRQKALSAGVLTDLDTLSNLYNAIQDNFDTDLSIREMASLGSFAEQLDRSHIVRKQLNNNPLGDGGFLYDGAIAVYGSAVLVPYGDNLDLIHQYTDLVFNHREIYYETAKIEILNATKSGGIAGEVADELKRFGFVVEEIGNYENEAGEKQFLPESLIEYSDWTEDQDGKITPTYQGTLTALDTFINASEVASKDSVLLPIPEGQEVVEGADKVYSGGAINIRIILGDDYNDFTTN